MENYKKISFPALLMKLAAMLAVSAFFAACNGSGGGGGGGAINNGYIMGGTALMNGTPVSTIYSQNPMNGVTLSLTTTVDINSYIYSTSMNLYNGPVGFMGQMNVAMNWYDLFGSGCQVAPGSYTVQSVNTATMSGGFLSQAIVVANPGNVVMEINGAMINGNRLVAISPGGIHVAQVNGINCSPRFGGTFN